MWAEFKSKIQSPKHFHRAANAVQVSEITLLTICAVAFALRLGLLFDNRFHPDEALFSTWALKIARGENLLLTGMPVDKPPLLIYFTALSFFVFGQSELAARVPNLIASVLSVPLLYQLARSLTPSPFPENETQFSGEGNDSRPLSRLESTSNREKGPGGEVSALLLALSPFAILFAPTAFLDPMMVMFGLASLVAASRGRAGWAGVLLALSFATKVQGLFFLPLIPVFWNRPADRETGHSISLFRYSIIRGVTGFVVIAIGVLLWDRARGGLPFWVQQTINYGGIRLIYASELAPRLTGWINFLPYFFGPIVGALGLIGLPFLLQRDLTRDTRTRVAWLDLWLLAYTIGFLAIHWLLAFPVWDRYLLILVPIVVLLVARSLQRIAELTRLSISPSLILSGIALAILPFSVAASRSGYPIGGDHGANDGIEQVADYLKALPSGTVVYDHWVAWELGYYMGDGFAYLAYFDTPAALADDLRVFAGHDDRFAIFPARESPAKVIDAVEQVGYTLTPVFATQDRFGQTSFTVYQIVRRKT
jgi:4-amino-4-deoxy-L-arabinose transferase-like glycosyltransferase